MSNQPPASSSAGFWVPLVGLIVWIFGFALSGMGGHEFLTALRCDASPAQLTLAEFAQAGPAGNDYVTLSDFEIQWNGYICFHEDNGRWRSSDVPLRIAGSDAPPKVLLRVRQPQSDEHLRELLAGSQLTGVVTGRGLGGDCAAELSALNPGIDPQTCWLVTFDQRPLDARTLGAIYAVGLGLFTLSFLLFAHYRTQPSPERAVLGAMSPLLLIVAGLHWLADRLPTGSGRICGAILLAPSALLAAWGAWRLWQASLVSAGEGSTLVEVLAIIAVDLGVALAAVGLSYLVVRPRGDGTLNPSPALTYGGVRA